MVHNEVLVENFVCAQFLYQRRSGILNRSVTVPNDHIFIQAGLYFQLKLNQIVYVRGMKTYWKAEQLQMRLYPERTVIRRQP